MVVPKSLPLPLREAMKKIARRLFRPFLFLLAVVAILAGAAWWTMRGSLASLDGELSLRGLSAPVQVERDDLGVVTIRAVSEADAARALGYVHGQERYFEMDLMRRSAAGELSELFGAIAVGRDKAARVHRLRSRVLENMDAFAGDNRPVLEAYSEGVNAGLHALRSKPWPYFLLRVEPRDWQPADTALVGYAMFFDLQDGANSRELSLWRIKRSVPEALYALLAADGTEWDAPLLGEARGNVVLPGADLLDLRKLPMPSADVEHAVLEPAAPGSNNFAVAGALTRDGRAIVANDMHLRHGVPNIWFRARLLYDDAGAPAGKVDVSGLTLPGVPGIITGSNRHVAWSFTNSYGDWLDFYRVEWVDKEKTRYRLPDGIEAIRESHENILVKGGQAVDFVVRETRWGPIVADEADGSALSLLWTAQMPGSLNINLTEMANAGNLDAALAVAGAVGIPGQNLIVGDSKGRIAWRLIAQMPDRVGDCDKTAPLTVAARCGWGGWLAGTSNPAVIDPPSHRLWTANARVVDGAALRLVGDGGHDNGARSKQIRDGLFAKEELTEADLLAIQLDDRALFLERWWKLMRQQAHAAKDPVWTDIEAATKMWEGRASTESVSYRITRAFRWAVIDRITHGLVAPAVAVLGKDFVMPVLPQMEGVAWQLVTTRPAHLLPRKFESWDALLLDAAKQILPPLVAKGPLPQRTWGEQNTSHICHPLAMALPSLLESLLCMPPDPLPGDINIPRVQGADFGASERMVVAPGHEEDGILHMPGGQSGHPLSPFWGAGHAAWVKGEPTPFLPGKSAHALTLNP